jgi:hypothetical protein
MELKNICDTEPLMRLPYGGLVEWKKRIDWSGICLIILMLVLLKVVTSPIFVFEKLFPLGIQIVVVEKNNLIYNHKPIQNITQTHEPNNHLYFF